VNASPFVSLRELLDDPLSPVGRLMAAGRRLARADRALEAALDPSLRGHVTVARVSRDSVILVADSPVWSSRVRFQSPAVLEHLRRELGAPGLARVQVLTRPRESVPPPRAPVATAPRLTERSAALVERVAQDTDNPALRRSLLRICRHACRDGQDR